MILDYEILDELSIKLTKIFSKDIEAIVTKLNREDKLTEFLKLIGYENIFNSSNDVYKCLKTGKILVIGESHISKDKLLSIGTNLGIVKERFEFNLDYNDAKTYPFNKLQYNEHYSLVLFGPIPHSTVNKDGYSSIINKMINEKGYPKVIKLGGNSMKITKSNFKESLQNAIKIGDIKTY